MKRLDDEFSESISGYLTKYELNAYRSFYITDVVLYRGKYICTERDRSLIDSEKSKTNRHAINVFDLVRYISRN